MKKKWTEGFGRQIATLSTMYGLISDTWSAMGIGPGIITWLKTEEGREELIAALRLLGEKFRASQSVLSKKSSILSIIDCSKSFDPSEFIRKDWVIWRGPLDGNGLSGEKALDKLSTQLAEVQVCSLLFESCIQNDGGEDCMTGIKKLSYLKNEPSIVRLGGNVFLGFWLDYLADKKGFSALELLYQDKKIKILYFPGLVLRSPDGAPCILRLYRQDDGWHWTAVWIGDEFDADNLAVCKNLADFM